MAYLIRSLGKRKKGDLIRIKSESNVFRLELISKENGTSLFFLEKEVPTLNLRTENSEINLKIPKNGFWQLRIFAECFTTNIVYDIVCSKEEITCL